MRKELSIAVLLASVVAPFGNALAAQESRIIELSVPRALRSGDAVELQVTTTAPLPPGARVVVETEQGDVIGAVTPFGVPAADGGSTATVPVPRMAIVDGRLRLRLQVVTQGAPPRAPRADEIKLNLIVSPTR
jgi:hypothetical protein